MGVSVTFEWGDGVYTFALRSSQLEELQFKCKGPDGKASGFGEITERVFNGRWYAADIYETIRLGLIGGGMPPVEAVRLTKTYVLDQPIAKLDDPSNPYQTAKAILSAAMFGLDQLSDDEETVGKDEAGTKREATSTSQATGPAS
jgi:hypothetical protein